MNEMRQVILDTETTGLSPQQGHRIIEIGCVELVNRRLTGKTFHTYLQPDREVDYGAVQVHGITTDFLKDKPRFNEIVLDFKNFIQGTELIIHNAPFDVGFIENEFKLAKDLAWQVLSDQCPILDTLALARQKHPGQRNSLDALCKRYNVSNQHRQKHGALLDAEILAEVYLAMTGGQDSLSFEEKVSEIQTQEETFQRSYAAVQTDILVVRATALELAEHLKFMERLEKSEK